MLAAKLECDFTPRGLSKGRSILSAPTADGIELRADEDGGFGLRHAANAGATEQLRNTGPFVGGRTVLGEMVEQRQRVRFSAAELRGEIEDGVRLRPLTGKAADDFCGEGSQVFGEIRPFEESLRLLIIRGSTALTDLIEMDGEFRRIERLAFSQVLARRDNFIPGFEGHSEKLVRDPVEFRTCGNKRRRRRFRLKYLTTAKVIEFGDLRSAIAFVFVLRVGIYLVYDLTA